MIEVLAYRGEQVTSGIEPAAISDIVASRDALVWVDMVDPSDDDFHCIQEEFSLHQLALEDASKHGQRPKLERYPTHAFVVAYSGDLAEVDLFVGPNWIVTVRGRGESGEPWNADVTRRRFERSGPEEATTGYLLYMILDALVDEYFDRIERAEDAIENIEEVVFSDELSDERGTQESLYAMRRELLLFRRRVQPLREVVAGILRRDVEWIDHVALTHFQDVFDHVLRAVEHLDSQRELLGNAVDAHLAIMSNRMNQVMKKMTSWGAILLVATLVAGIYGMNFDHMPELRWQFGYAWALGLMGLITGAGYAMFKRRDWL